MKMSAKRKVVKDEPTSSKDSKFDVMLKTMENFVDNLTPPKAEP